MKISKPMWKFFITYIIFTCIFSSFPSPLLLPYASNFWHEKQEKVPFLYWKGNHDSYSVDRLVSPVLEEAESVLTADITFVSLPIFSTSPYLLFLLGGTELQCALNLWKVLEGRKAC